MAMMTFSRLKRWLQPSSFTLIEMLSVIAIIAILAGLILWAGNAMMIEAARSRASAEIKGMGAALENYKVDNGAYPADSHLDGPPSSSYSLDPSVVGGSYQLSSETLYLALSGQTNFNATPTGVKSYFTFKANQVGNPTGSGVSGLTGSYVQDPFNFSYGYSPGMTTSSGTTYTPYNGSGFYDLWSTAGTTANTTSGGNTVYATNSWVNNWTQ